MIDQYFPAEPRGEDPPHDPVLHGVIGFLDTRSWIQLSYTCKTANAFKYDKHLMIHKPRTMRKWKYSLSTLGKILRSFRAARGTLFNVDISSYSPEDHNLVPLAGTIHTLRIARCESLTSAAFPWLRTVRKLELQKTGDSEIRASAFRHIEHLDELTIPDCGRAVTDRSLERFRDLRVLSIPSSTRITDATFEHAHKLQTLDMGGCGGQRITNKAFETLTDLRTLNIAGCPQITDQGLANLSKLTSLDMSFCTLPTITDSVFEHLPALRELDITTRVGITEAAFAHLTKLRHLRMSNMSGISGQALTQLVNLECLDIYELRSHTLTDDVFRHMPKLHTLAMARVTSPVTGGAFAHLPNLTSLDISGCQQFNSEDSFRHLGNLTSLAMDRCWSVPCAAVSSLHKLTTLKSRWCSQISDSAFWGLWALEDLDISWCHQRSLSGYGLYHLTGLKRLVMVQCHQTTIGDKAFERLANLEELDISHCAQNTLTEKMFKYMPRLRKAHVRGCGRDIEVAAQQQIDANHRRGINPVLPWYAME
jgi:Leucine-rich repeat (LRR) protein